MKTNLLWICPDEPTEKLIELYQQSEIEVTYLKECCPDLFNQLLLKPDARDYYLILDLCDHLHHISFWYDYIIGPIGGGAFMARFVKETLPTTEKFYGFTCPEYLNYKEGVVDMQEFYCQSCGMRLPVDSMECYHCKVTESSSNCVIYKVFEPFFCPTPFFTLTQNPIYDYDTEVDFWENFHYTIISSDIPKKDAIKDMLSLAETLIDFSKNKSEDIEWAGTTTAFKLFLNRFPVSKRDTKKFLELARLDETSC
jgi:hypothetical protein